MKNVGASVRTRLMNRRQTTGEDFNLLLTRHCLERLLFRLSRSEHRDQFILKGALLFAVWGTDFHRATRDLDLLGFGDPSLERLVHVFREICGVQVEPDGPVFDPASVQAEEIRTLDEYSGVRVTLVAEVDRAKVHLQVDVGFGDALPIPPQEVEFPSLLDLPRPILRAYSRETVVAEKLEAIVRFGMLNTRFRDYFDLHYLAQNFEFSGQDLATAIAATFQRRQTHAPDGIPVGLTATFANDPAKIHGWEAFNRRMVGAKSALPLSSVVTALSTFLGPALEAAIQDGLLNAHWRSGKWNARNYSPT